MIEKVGWWQTRETPVVSLSKLTLSVSLCDYADCRKPLHTVLPCAKNKGISYCSKDFL